MGRSFILGLAFLLIVSLIRTSIKRNSGR